MLLSLTLTVAPGAPGVGQGSFLFEWGNSFFVASTDDHAEAMQAMEAMEAEEAEAEEAEVEEAEEADPVAGGS